MESRMGGSNPDHNFKLASWLLAAKKAGIPKANMEAAVKRGQGLSASGKALEYLTVEAMIPPQIGMILEAETDNSKRTMGDLRYEIKEAGGVVTPTNYLFQKKGKLVFEKHETVTVDEIFDLAVDLGATDYEEEEGVVIVWTEPSTISCVSTALQEKLHVKLESQSIIWDPNEDTRVAFDIEQPDAVTSWKRFVDKVRESSELNVQGIYANIGQGKMNEDAWEEIVDRLDT